MALHGLSKDSKKLYCPLHTILFDWSPPGACICTCQAVLKEQLGRPWENKETTEAVYLHGRTEPWAQLHTPREATENAGLQLGLLG